MISKEAKKEYDKKYRELNKEKLKEKTKVYYQNNKDVIISKSINYSKAHKENKKEYDRKRCLENKEYKKEYDRINKDRIRQVAIQYNSNRRKIDPVFKLRKDISSLILCTLKNEGFKKYNKTLEILGCSIEEFKTHLESKFEPWMNWNNRGNWNGIPRELNVAWDIDHIVPVSSVNTEEKLLKLNHYTNLQPLCSYTNRWIKRNQWQE